MQTEFNITELHQEAHHRWLKPAEVFFLLQNYERQHLTAETPQNPQSGSLFLFNRRILRFFRKDGHLWRKKKDGKTVGEAHERLKVGNVDMLNCYYAHGETNQSFQRRSYWILDRAWEHIVLVHYRDINEGKHSTGSMVIVPPDSSSLHSQSALVHSAPIVYGRSSFTPDVSTDEVSSSLPSENHEMQHFGVLDGGSSNFVTYTGHVNQALRRLAEQLSLEDTDVIGFPEKISPYPFQPDEPLNSQFLVGQENTGYGMKTIGLKFPALSEQPGLDDKAKSQKLESGSGSWKEVVEKCSASSELEACHVESVKDQDQPQLFRGKEYSFHESAQFNRQLSATRKFLLESDDAIDTPMPSRLINEVASSLASSYSEASTHESGLSMLQKMNSIGWMERSLDIRNSNRYSSPNFYDMSFDEQHRLGTTLIPASLSIAEVQRFSILDVSPEWAYCTDRAKVLIVGDFLRDSSSSSWACMFGDIEVSAEVVQNGVLRCYAPHHSVGMVPLCITTRNREACSEVKEFEFRSKEENFPPSDFSQSNFSAQTDDELILIVRLAEILLVGTDSFSVRKANCSESGGEIPSPIAGNSLWSDIVEAILGGLPPQRTMGWVIDELFKDKLLNWLLSKFHQSNESDPTSCVLSKQEQGVIHLIAALGYDWGLLPILNTGVGVNFRDANGWTALHWAARYGREKMVGALVACGASAGAVTDPTSVEPSGKNPASIAAECGHKGLAGYLSEVALTTHLESLKLEEDEISKGSAVLEAERTVEIVSDKSKQVITNDSEDQLSFKDSLAAVRNAAQAAARIQAAFRAHSFRERQQITALDDYGMYPCSISALSKFKRVVRNIPDHNHKINRAALSIQKNYRGWKRRKEYQNLRRNVVKIQAHVRGHQVRKKYKEFLWTVGVVEKAILRWRRKGSGLRGFKSESETTDMGEEDDDILKVFRKQKVDATVQKAISRVLSMVDSPDARHQYSRMLDSYQLAKAQLVNNPSDTGSNSLDNWWYMDEEAELYFDIGASGGLYE